MDEQRETYNKKKGELKERRSKLDETLNPGADSVEEGGGVK